MKINTFGTAASLQKHLRPRLRGVWLILIVAMCSGAATPAGAGEDGGEQKGRREALYQPYTEAEIQEALQRPLKLQDCIRIALARNLTLKQARGNWERARVSHAGSYGIYFPVLTVDGTRASNHAETPDSLGKFAESQSDRQTAVVGRAQVATPLGTVFEYQADLLREAQYPRASRSKNEDRTYSLTVTQPLLRGAGLKSASSKILFAASQRQAQEHEFVTQRALAVFNVKSA